LKWERALQAKKEVLEWSEGRYIGMALFQHLNGIEHVMERVEMRVGYIKIM